ncbi:MAG: AsmA family protein [Kiloniellaceae bacterium]
MKKALLVIVVLVIVALGALLVLPSFWDWNGEKDRIAAWVKQQSGRDLTIAGDVTLHLLPAPAFSAREVTLANIEGGSDAAMVQLEELRVRVALLPLLSGTVRVESVTLVKPQVRLEVLPDGRANWDFAGAPRPGATGPGATGPGAAGPGGPDPDASDPGASPPGAAPAKLAAAGEESIRVDSFIIEGGRVRYSDAQTGRTEVVDDLNAELGAESLIGPFVAGGAATYQGVPVEFDFSLDRVIEGGATAVSLSLTLPRSDASGQFLGALSRHDALRTLRGRLQVKGDDLGRMIAGLPLAAPLSGLPPQLAQPFELSAEITGSDSEATADAVAFSLGPVLLGGKISARLGDVPDFTVDLAAKTVDLDKLLALQGAAPAKASAAARPQDNATTAAVPAAPDADAGTMGAGAGFELPKTVSASVTLSADALLYRGQTVRQVRAAARLEGGEVTLEQAAAQLPGSSDVALSGRLSAAKGPRFDGTLEARSDSLRGLLQWLGVDTSEVPADRLRRMVVKTGFEAGADRITLRETDLQLDVSRLTGGIAIALRDRPGLGIGVTLDKINLDAYLPDQGAPAPTTGTPQRERAVGESGAVPGVAPAPARNEPAGMALLGGFDANFDVKVGQLTYRGVPLNGLRLDATLQRGGVVVRELSVADLAGSRGSFAGSLANIDRDPSVDGSLDISVAALSRLTKALGIDGIGQLPLESFSLAGAVNGNRDQLRFDQSLTALNGTLRAAGKAELQPAALAIDAAVKLNHPDLSVLLGELLRDSEVPAGLGPVALQGQLSAAPAALQLSALEGEIAGVKILAGDVGLGLAGARPKVTAELTTGVMPLAALAAPAAAGKKSGKTQGKTGAGQSAKTGSGGDSRPAGRGRWSTKPIDVAALRDFDADLKLHAKAILIDQLRLSDAEVEAVLAGGLLDLKRFDAKTYGGTLSVTGTADARATARDGLEIATAVAATNIEMKDLLRDMTDSDRFSGPMSLRGNLNSQGSSEAALVSALSGSGKLDGSITAAAKVEEQAGALLLGILGKKVKEVQGITDSTTMLFGAFAGAPAKVDGTFVVDQGVLRSDDLRVRGRDAVAMTAGNANLPVWRVESRTDVFRDADPQTAYLTAVLRGPLDSPDVGINGQPFQRRQEPAAVEIAPVDIAPLDTAPAEQEQQKTRPSAPAKPEDLLKEGLKSLLKGLGG